VVEHSHYLRAVEVGRPFHLIKDHEEYLLVFVTFVFFVAFVTERDPLARAATHEPPRDRNILR
jgi:hypothetical protein